MAGLRAAPLARRKVMLVTMLVDAFVDRLFAAGGRGDDILDFRQDVARNEPVLGRVMALCAAQGGGQMTIQAVAVPLAEYGTLSTADFMVSLYNDHSVQRLLLVDAEGQPHDMLAVLDGAIAALDRMLAGG